MTVFVASLGYFVDIYDLQLFNMVSKKSLIGIGITDPALIDKYDYLLFLWQMGGMLVGGLLWGILGDKKGRKSILFGSILMYSLANIANAFVVDVHQYAAVRFFAGLGLAGELGAAITLVSEIMDKEKRGYGTMIIVATGALGAGDCTPVYNPNPDDAWTGVINRGPTSSNTTEAIGVYANDSITLTERLILNLGVRWDQYSVKGVNQNATQSAGMWTLNPQIPAPGSTLAPGIVAVPEQTWEFTNYQVGLVFKPTQNSSVYASWSTSSTPPTISAGDQNASGGLGTVDGVANTVLDPEDTESFEVGAKANVLNDRLALSAAAFHLTRKNALILVEPNIFRQEGEVEVNGFELGVSGSITPKWTVFGGYTYMDSELTKAAVVVSGTPPVASVNPLQGLPLANTPKHSASLFTTYRVLPRLTVGGGVYYTSKSLGGNQGGAGGGNNRIYAPEWTRVDAFAAYDLTDRATLQLNVKNVTDEEYIMRTNGVHHADVAAGRQAILALNLRF